MPVELTCVKCGGLFKVPPSTFKKGTVKYCSRKCHYDATRGVSFINAGSFKNGHVMTKEIREKISTTMTGQKIGFAIHPRIGEMQWNWKGSNVGMTALHDWVKLHKQKSECCQQCGKKADLDCANISGQYFRDVDDYIWLCKSCHARYDRKGFKRRGDNGKKF